MALRGEFSNNRSDVDSAQGGPRAKELKARREKNLMEYIDVTVNNLKHTLKHDLDEEKSRKNYRFNEVQNLIEHHKELTDEHI